ISSNNPFGRSPVVQSDDSPSGGFVSQARDWPAIRVFGGSWKLLRHLLTSQPYRVHHASALLSQCDRNVSVEFCRCRPQNSTFSFPTEHSQRHQLCHSGLVRELRTEFKRPRS